MREQFELYILGEKKTKMLILFVFIWSLILFLDLFIFDYSFIKFIFFQKKVIVLFKDIDQVKIVRRDKYLVLVLQVNNKHYNLKIFNNSKQLKITLDYLASKGILIEL